MSDDIILDLITDTVPREEQLSLFTGAERYGISGVEVEEVHTSKSGRKKKAKKLDPNDFGRGKIERRRSMLSRVDDVPFDELTVRHIQNAFSSCKTRSFLNSVYPVVELAGNICSQSSRYRTLCRIVRWLGVNARVFLRQ